ncbi:MAG: hypothetical protein KDD82_15680 [Planctomycetes bacterium]|nr:hypothetical protein [Planctomycetota bacterium]
MAALGAVLATVSPAYAEGESAGEGSIVLVQESNGFPGGEQTTQLALQQVTICGDALRVFDPVHDWALFVDLGEQVVREARVTRAEFEARPFAHYQKYRADRVRSLERQRDQFVQMREKVEDDPSARERLEREYARIGGDPAEPGRIRASLERQDEEREVTLRIDHRLRRVRCTRYVIRENAKQQPAFDLWITEDVQIPVNLLDYYEQLVPFGPEVSAELAKVKGTLVECLARVDTGTFHKTYVSKLVELRHEPVDPAEVAVPASFEQVERSADSAAEEDPMVTCVMTGERIPRAEAKSWTHPRTMRRYWIKDSQQLRALIKLAGKGGTPPYADQAK